MRGRQAEHSAAGASEAGWGHQKLLNSSLVPHTILTISFEALVACAPYIM
jgi:hypothetical protein